MASEREKALSEVVQSSPNPDPKISDALTEAENKRLEIENTHKFNMRRAELGWFGKVFGSEGHAAMVIAFVAVVMGFMTAIGLWALGYFSGRADVWSSEAHFALGAATSALGYVFGRGSRDK